MQHLATFIILATLSLAGSRLLAQGAVQPDWVLHKAGTVAGGVGEAWGVDVDAGGSIYWGVSETRPGVFQGLDCALYKLSPSGEEVWSSPALYGGPFTQQIYATSVSGDTAYFCGRACSNASVNLETCDMVIAAVNTATGDTLWSRTWGRGHGYEEADWVAVKDDGLYIGGWSQGELTDWDAGLIHLGFDGSLIWQNAWGTEGTDHQDGHIFVDDSMIYGGGLYNGGASTLIILKGYDGSAMLAKWRRSDGSYVNHVAFGRDDPWTNLENALGLGSDGTYLYVVGNTTVGPSDNQMFIRKYDKNLNLQWERLWGGSVTETSRSVVIGADSNIYVAASTSSYGAGDFDAAIVEYSSDGDFKGYRTWGGTGDDQAYDIATHDGMLYVTGRTTSLSTAGTAEGFLIAVKTDAVAGIEEPGADERGSNVRGSNVRGSNGRGATRGGVRAGGGIAIEINHPDPSATIATISFSLPHAANARVSVHDILGRETALLGSGPMERGWHTIEWDAGDLPSGRYFVRVETSGGAVTAPVVLAR